ncbi:MAG: tyrosine-type recombinase/integrase [Tannerella sp.]|jgi:integrase|nr:tyrosine-type recombinase/integrase [Tannerella sp.]
MNVSKLQKNHPLLLEYLHDNGYSRSHIQWMKRCIRLVLNEGSSPGIESYEQLYWHEVEKGEYKETAQVRKTLKSVLGCVKRFEQEGIYPQPRLCHGFMAPTKSYDLLGDEYRSIIDHYERTAGEGTKVAHTIYTERRAGIQFLLHLQNAGVASITNTTERAVLDFFFDGEKIIRGRAYREKITPVLKSAITLYGEPVRRLLSLIPSIPKSYSNYPYLTRSESDKFRIWLEEENTQLTLLDKAIATLAYYTGLRGTDILSLKPDNIDWKKETIHLVQSKTGMELTLPMSAIVGNAIWDYLVYERPGSGLEDETVFVNGCRPYNKISSIWDHLKNVFNEAGVRTDGGRTGVRIFRHHLATALLGNRIPSPVISSILGHTSPESIIPCVDADIEHLRECSLDITGYPVAKEVFES